MAMATAYRIAALVGCLLVSLFAGAQVGSASRKVVLPSPQLVHCRAAECSQLWKQDSRDGGTVYPAQILTDFVNGEVVGLTAVYDKSVSREEIRAAIDALYGKSPQVAPDIWRIEPEQLAISVFDGLDGAKEVTYLKFGTFDSHVPSAHLDCPGKSVKKPWFLP
jgi:hypothetical protein